MEANRAALHTGNLFDVKSAPFGAKTFRSAPAFALLKGLPKLKPMAKRAPHATRAPFKPNMSPTRAANMRG